MWLECEECTRTQAAAALPAGPGPALNVPMGRLHVRRLRNDHAAAGTSASAGPWENSEGRGRLKQGAAVLWGFSGRPATPEDTGQCCQDDKLGTRGMTNHLVPTQSSAMTFRISAALLLDGGARDGCLPPSVLSVVLGIGHLLAAWPGGCLKARRLCGSSDSP